MFIEKHLYIKTIVALFLGIIPCTVSISPDCDVIKKFFSHIKGDIYDEILRLNNCCDIPNIIWCNELNHVQKM